MPVLEQGRPLRVCIAGFGMAGRCHAETWAGMDGVDVVGVHSLRPETEAPAVAAACGPDVPVFGSFAGMLDAVECDFVSICTLHDTHAAEIIEAVGRGLHVLLEKPICLTPEDLIAVRKAVKAAGTRVFIGFQEFHYGQLQATIEAVEKGYLGRVHLAEIEYFNGINPSVQQYWWARTKRVGGSSMLFCGCHPLMLLMNLMKDTRVAEVSAFSTHSSARDFEALEWQATQVNLIRFEDGRIGKVTSCLDSLHPYYWRNSLIGDEGSLIDTRILSRTMMQGLEPQGWTELATRSINDAGVLSPDMFTPMFGRILANLREDAPMPYSGFDAAWEMHRILFACEEAARTGRPVVPDQYLAPPG
ncbi:Gfo/Idh/MocA family protein [Mangrovicoccus sp. HB161399]|uniref:Gfo/Idh/MocA family protein n=1 Tax=Mangrovicoccus sp. HB161399 TaxID=2720392 RepID=UPI0015575508|nr:Gfo/Idh/MocA family oxidoreductase [Mangrovicoccus sp. HB161399]